MKMTKLLAIGSAAAVAVASLASVASAKEQTFDMAITKGTIKLAQSAGNELGSQYALSQADIDAGKTLGISADDALVLALADNSTDADKITGVSLSVTGVKGTRASSSKTYTYKFTQFDDADCTSQNYDGTGKYFQLKMYKEKGPSDSFVPSQFVEITKIELNVDGEKTVVTAADYDAWGTSSWGSYNGAALKFVSYGWAAGGIGDDIAKLAYTPWGFNYANEKSTSNDYPFIAKLVTGANNTLMRQDIQLLSYSDSYRAETNGGSKDGNQTSGDNGMGTNPLEFAGLASQCADFFNKQTNGTITFKFTTAAAASGTVWANGGIPSTQVGIKNVLGDATVNDFALFFNYDQTGSLQAISALDEDAGEVSFDINEILDELGGHTKGVVDNIWFGLAKGVKYDDGRVGLKVESVTLAYDEDDDADVEEDDDDDTVEDDDDDTDIDDEDEDDDDDDTADDEDDDDEDDDVVIDEDDDDDDDTDADDDTDVAGDTVIVKPSTDDSNPNTGVALAVVPAAIAAAAVVVSKKRK